MFYGGFLELDDAGLLFGRSRCRAGMRLSFPCMHVQVGKQVVLVAGFWQLRSCILVVRGFLHGSSLAGTAIARKVPPGPAVMAGAALWI